MNKYAKLMLVLAVVAGAGYLYMTFGTATIAVTSEPSGAIVRVDGRQRGLTPLARLELSTGKHKLEVEHSHLQPYVEGLNLSRGDHLAREITLVPGTGTLQLLSNPKGAWVEVDGERLPEPTPTTLEVASGEHEIAMGQDERKIVTQTHTVKHGQSVEVNFNLNIDPHGSLTIATRPRDARVEFIGETLEYAPKMRVPIGEYSVRVSRAGYVARELRLGVRYGDNLHEVSLERDYGQLTVRVSPAQASIRLSYRDGGRTRTVNYTGPVRLPVGRVEVQASALGYRTATRRVDLSNPGDTVRLNLQTMNVQPGRVFSDKLDDGSDGPELVVIPAGSFAMGDASGPPSQQPVHTVTLTQPFAVTRHEITIGQYLKYLQATGGSLHQRLDAQDTTHPIAYVDYDDVEAYAAWLSQQTGEKYRALSESEWEYVARAGSDTPYFWGNDELQLCLYANIADRTARRSYRDWDTVACEDNMVRPGPVGSYDPNPFGIYDIYGNVAEWVSDCGMPSYQSAPRDGSPGEQGGCGSRGVRGGSWDSPAIEASSPHRYLASSANDDRGIRLLRVL